MNIQILQYGEGNFLRGFFDWMVEIMNRKGLWDASVICVKPRPGRKIQSYNPYTVCIRGIDHGKAQEDFLKIQAIQQYLGCYEDYADYIALAQSPDLKLIVSNTTEAGLACNVSDRPDDTPPASYPGKVCQFLYARWKAFSGDASAGLILMPMELVENNGQRLKDLILREARLWQYEETFLTWVETSCTFINTLVDRIVPGYPTEDANALFQRLKYTDPLMVACEPYHFLALEPVGADIEQLKEMLPFAQAGLNVVWTKNLSPYRIRKIRILNGAHSAMCPVALSAGLKTVEDCMHDPDISLYLDTLLRDEVLPTVPLPEEELTDYVGTVRERFLNPYLHHHLESIALNHTAKWASRLLPTLKDIGTACKAQCITFSLAAQISYDLQTENLQDLPEIQVHYSRMRDMSVDEVTKCTLSQTDLWGEDLTEIEGLSEGVSADLKRILTAGIRQAIKECCR